MYYKIQLNSYPKEIHAYSFIQWAFINLEVFARKINDKFVVTREDALDALRKKGSAFKEVADTYFCCNNGWKEFIVDPENCKELE